jgi:hypothetical protein
MVWHAVENVGRVIVYAGTVIPACGMWRTIVAAIYVAVCIVRPPFGPDKKVVASWGVASRKPNRWRANGITSIKDTFFDNGVRRHLVRCDLVLHCFHLEPRITRDMPQK